MKLVNAIPNEVCDPYTNAFGCIGNTETYYSITGCCLVVLTVTIYGIYVLAHRWISGIQVTLLRRADGYWLPAPLDSFTIICCPCWP